MPSTRLRDGAHRRTLLQSIVSPVISTSLYFVVFGAAIGSRITEIDGVAYGSFIVPGLIMLSLLTQSVSNASFGIYFPKFTGTIYELLSAPVSSVEIVIGYVGAAATKSIILGLIILATRRCSCRCGSRIRLWMADLPRADGGDVQPVRLHHRHLGEGFEQLQVIPLLVITPLTFLGGSFYSISVLPPFWQKVALFNPVVYLVSGFRWSFSSKSPTSARTLIESSFALLDPPFVSRSSILASTSLVCTSTEPVSVSAVCPAI
jgi:ABC-2 type transport system permease protein